MKTFFIIGRGEDRENTAVFIRADNWKQARAKARPILRRHAGEPRTSAVYFETVLELKGQAYVYAGDASPINGYTSALA